jgi:NAD(P)-dependent dehydrogenase (short-subunit alcohol dehydrogenase family)
MTHTEPAHAAIVIGSGGGIGGALADMLGARAGWDVRRVGRRESIRCDFEHPETIAPAMERALAGLPVSLVLIASGMLHDGTSAPEKSLRELDAGWLARQFAVNSIGPALVLAAILPRLPRDRPVRVAVLGARVGSISDNRLGGWYGYRASKAALHQLVRTAAIEWARSHPQGVLAALHPGTVATPLSAPFTARRAQGELMTPDQSAAALLSVLEGLPPSRSGRIFDWKGAEIMP